MISNTSRYAIRALVYLAINSSEKQKIGIKKIAEDLDIPSPFLGKILQTLVKQHMLASTKGPNGGFGINDATKNISLIKIINIFDGDDLFNNCLITNKICDIQKKTACSLHDPYEKIRDDIKVLFTKHSVGSLAEEFRKSQMKIDI